MSSSVRFLLRGPERLAENDILTVAIYRFTIFIVVRVTWPMTVTSWGQIYFLVNYFLLNSFHGNVIFKRKRFSLDIFLVLGEKKKTKLLWSWSTKYLIDYLDVGFLSGESRPNLITVFKNDGKSRDVLIDVLGSDHNLG